MTVEKPETAADRDEIQLRLEQEIAILEKIIEDYRQGADSRKGLLRTLKSYIYVGERVAICLSNDPHVFFMSASEADMTGIVTAVIEENGQSFYDIQGDDGQEYKKIYRVLHTQAKMTHRRPKYLKDVDKMYEHASQRNWETQMMDRAREFQARYKEYPIPDYNKFAEYQKMEQDKVTIRDTNAAMEKMRKCIKK